MNALRAKVDWRNDGLRLYVFAGSGARLSVRGTSRGLKGHEIAPALAWVYISTGTGLKGRQKIALRHVVGFRCTFSISNPANRVFFLQGATK